ncbi:hypothetical protein EJB05_28894 [Eragrostis curvula]|uniref:DUF4216 domain-containing protein n=1 Tax=Eragrostis curvula TaxID=38414 RepID=A0A5J9USW0_9POAL|nr:hypothetical protein EJB05_28894 [Eragrostis curvula]
MINGWRFNTKDRDMLVKSQNSGVFVQGDDESGNKDYFGVLIDIIKLTYGKYSDVLFKCDWWDVHATGRGVYYVKDTVDPKWLVVVKTKPRDLYDVPPDEDDDEDEESDITISNSSNNQACQENEYITVALSETMPDDIESTILKRPDVEGEAIVANPKKQTHNREEDDEEEEEEDSEVMVLSIWIQMTAAMKVMKTIQMIAKLPTSIRSSRDATPPSRAAAPPSRTSPPHPGPQSPPLLAAPRHPPPPPDLRRHRHSAPRRAAPPPPLRAAPRHPPSPPAASPSHGPSPPPLRPPPPPVPGLSSPSLRVPGLPVATTRHDVRAATHLDVRAATLLPYPMELKRSDARVDENGSVLLV